MTLPHQKAQSTGQVTSRPKTTQATDTCPLCGEKNACAALNMIALKGEHNGNVIDKTNTESCWCMTTNSVFSPELLASVPQQARGKACICQQCLTHAQQR